MRNWTILFVRQFVAFSGGHLKVLDYMSHVASTDWAKPAIYLTPDSDPALISEWIPKTIERVDFSHEADLFFLAGLDWKILDSAGRDLSRRPVINFVQGLRHARTDDPRYSYLRRPATRICVSPEVATAIQATGVVNGPVTTIPNGVALGELDGLQLENRIKRAFIGGLKNPQLAAECAEVLTNEGVPVDLCIQRLPRMDYLRRLAASEISILLPLREEGFYLPALEAMALGVVPVVPDCVGARGFCQDRRTCLVPAYTVRDICDRAKELFADSELRGRLRVGGSLIATKHSLSHERERFLGLLRHCLSLGEQP